ncbi:MDR family MFS transporter [Amycolatopsis sp. NPDC051903]|uniref:MDR family MFS transporter n=1 Tax=Amycolatopsis sp. NPDC051903 TaxID=3363936 RepID=UPI0037A5EE5B
MTALVLAVLLASLDQTIVSTAIPRIAAELNGFSDIAWVSAAYLLASTAVTPLWGKLGDMLGRKRLYLVATSTFLVASALCGLARNLPELIAARTLQGVAGGGMIVLTFALVGDLVSAAERGRYQGLFGSVYGVASIVGPLLGGVFTDQLSWRWAFLINVPVGLVALVIAARALPAAKRTAAARIDYLGAVLLAGAATALVLIASFGQRWGWTSPGVLGLGFAALVLIALVIPVERRAGAPVLPLSLFSSRTVVLSSAVGFIANVAMFSVLVYLPTYLQIVDGVTATLSGVHMLPLVVGLVVSQSLAGRWAAHPARRKTVLVTGMALNVAGLLLLSTLAPHTVPIALFGYFFVTGIGIGLVPMVVMTAVQNSVAATDLGAASAVVTFARSIGAAFGVAAFGSLLASDFARRIPAHTIDPTRPDTIAALPADVRAPLLTSFADAIGHGFLWLVPLVAAGTVLAALLKTKAASTGSERQDLDGTPPQHLAATK